MAFGSLNGLRVIGIYMIRNTTNGKFYVGSSVNVESRIFKHLSFLRRLMHNNAHLQAAFTLSGEDAFEYVLLESCSREDLLSREQHYIDALAPSYNICKIAGNTLGVLHGPQAKIKMSAANMGNKRMLGKQHTDATKALIGALAAQRTHTADARAKISESLKGNQHTAGRPLSDEHKAKVGKASLVAWSREGRRAEASAKARARWADPEWKAIQSARIKEGRQAKATADGAAV